MLVKELLQNFPLSGRHCVTFSLHALQAIVMINIQNIKQLRCLSGTMTKPETAPSGTQG
jgi:hypothetical protein